MTTLTYHEIPDVLWERIEPLFAHLTRTKPGGSTPTPFRTLLAGMLYRLKTGCQWGMIPKQYGSKTTLHEHYQRWVRTGVFAGILERIAVEFDNCLGFDFEWQAMDGSLVQAPVRKKNSMRGTGSESHRPWAHRQQDPSACGQKRHPFWRDGCGSEYP